MDILPANQIFAMAINAFAAKEQPIFDAMIAHIPKYIHFKHGDASPGMPAEMSEKQM